MKQLYQKKDALLNPSFCIPPSDTVYNLVLAADTAGEVDVPAGAKYVVFSSTASIWVNYNQTASIPTVSLTAGMQSELNPAGRYLGRTPSTSYDTISIVSETDGAKVSLLFYSE
jgi:hypothetical protein